MTVPESPGADRTEEIVAPGTAEVGEGDVLAGRYELRRCLGVGGMSRVFLAHDRELSRDVAVKLLLRTGAAEDLDRLRDEARAAASIDHPGVVTVHDVGATAAGVHVVMSYVEGESLAQRLDREGPLAPDAVAAIGRAVCDALGAAHRAGVVHRDVSPGNVMLRPDGGVTVTDFGIARIGEGAGRTTTGHIIGTPAYIAPEQGRGTARIDGRADLYALGCCLFAALTGRPPFTDPDPVSVVLAHIRQTPPRPSTLRDDVPPALEQTLLRALAKDPGRRYPDAAAMAADLDAVAGPDGYPVTDAAGAARTRDLTNATPDGDHGTLTLPEPRRPEPDDGAPRGPDGDSGALDRALSDAEGDEGAASDRRRTAGLVFIALAVLLVLGAVIAVVVLG